MSAPQRLWRKLWRRPDTEAPALLLFYGFFPTVKLDCGSPQLDLEALYKRF